MLDYDIEFIRRKIQEMVDKIGLTFEEVIEALQKRIEQQNKFKNDN